ncbi:hypothetical protein G6045_18675 [Streptomyces sp. YC504]|uniref:Uncharacterized protein n=1 Tax=Streptomyces mesophilus TaxID=1775132 RepID=A0A6G4XJS9_9ACTN|nr:hypothetical protein [Streptomyces mesophilus]NGO77668.1 hypothetical protein [Streptomyces mesophilus]
MISHTGSLFNEGPARRVLETALRVQESGGSLDLDAELKRVIRTSRATGSSRWLCPVPVIAALLDQTADLTEAADVTVPRTFGERLDKARGETSGAEYLHTLAGVIRLLEHEPDASFEELPMAEWEVSVRFPALSGFGPNWIYDGEYESLSDSIQAFIVSEHPFCDDELHGIAGEAQLLLVLFPGPQAIAANIGRALPWVTHEVLRELCRAVNDHMWAAHSAS